MLKHAQRETDLGILLISVIFVTHRQPVERSFSRTFSKVHTSASVSLGSRCKETAWISFRRPLGLPACCLGLVPKVERKGIANPGPLGGWNALFE